MKEITIQIPDNKVDIFLELLENLQAQVSKMQEDDIFVPDFHNIPDFHKEIVMERMKKHTDDPKLMLDWDKVCNTFNLG